MESSSFWRVALAVVIVGVPALGLEQYNSKWAWSYVALILLMFGITHSRALARTGAAFGKELNQ